MLQRSIAVTEMKDYFFMASLENDETQEGIYMLKVITTEF